MATRTLTVILAGDTKGLSGALDQAGGELGKFAKVAASAGVAGAAAIGGVTVASVKMTSGLDKGLSEVRTLLPDLSDKGFRQLRDQVVEFSNDMGVATSETLPALYQAISAGVPPDNVFEFLQTANKAAVGGVTDLQTSVDGISSVVNAYGSDVLDAAKASDLMFTAVRLGKTDFEQLSSSLFNVVPIAAAAGVGFEDVTAGLARLTAQGTPTSVAATRLRSAIQALVAPTKEGKKQMEELGLSFDEATLREKGLDGALNDLYDATGGNIDQLRQIVGSVEGVQAILGLTGKNAEGFRDALDEMNESAGSTDKAFETMADTFDFKVGKGINLVKNLLLDWGDRVLPLVERALDEVLPFLENLGDIIETRVVPAIEDMWSWMEDNLNPVLRDLWEGQILPLIEGIRNWMADNEELVNSLKIAVPIVLAIGAAIVAVKLAVGGLVVVMGVLLSPVVLIGAAIAGLTALFVHLYRTNEGFREFIDEKLIPTFKAVAEWVMDRVGAAFRWIATFVTETLMPAIGAIVGWVIEEGIPRLSEFVSFLWDNLQAAFKAVKDWVETYVLPAWESIQNGLEAAWEVIEPILTWLGETAIAAVKGIIDFVTENWKSIETLITAPIQYAIDTAIGIFDTLRTFVEGLLLLITGDWEGALDKMAELPRLFFDQLKRSFEFMLDIGGAIIDIGKSLGEKLLDAFLGALAGLAGAVGDIVSSAFSGIGDLVPDWVPGFASGGFVPATPGGRIVRVAEGGEGEFIVPASRMGRMGSGVRNYSITVNAGTGDPAAISDAVYRAIQELESTGAIAEVSR